MRHSQSVDRQRMDHFWGGGGGFSQVKMVSKNMADSLLVTTDGLWLLLGVNDQVACGSGTSSAVSW